MATSLPTSVRVIYDPPDECPQQAIQQQLAVFEGPKLALCVNGAAVVGINHKFTVYTVKQGLIRVLSSADRSLLRAHHEEIVTDLQFFDHESDVLATVSHGNRSSRVVIWRIFERQGQIASDILLQVQSSRRMERVHWHPFNPNQFWILLEGGATLLETTRISTTNDPIHQHAVANLDAVSGALRIPAVTDVCWNPIDARYLLSVDEQNITLWDLKEPEVQESNGVVVTRPKILQQATDHEEDELDRCVFLPKMDVADSEGITPLICVGSRYNRVLTIWSAFRNAGPPPHRLQVIDMGKPGEFLLEPSSYILNVTKSSPAFLTLCSRDKGRVYAFMIKPTGCEYVVPFATAWPVYSADVTTTDTTHAQEGEANAVDFDLELTCYQQAAVQKLTLPSSICGMVPKGPPHGVTVQPLEPPMAVSDQEFEDYEVDEDYEEVDEDGDKRTPIPDTSLTNNPFANWLGAIAAKTTGTTPPPPPPSPATSSATSYLSPADMLNNKKKERNNNYQQHQVTPAPSRPEKPVAAAASAVVMQPKAPPAPQQQQPKAPPAPKQPVLDEAAIVEQVRRMLREEMRTTVIPSLRQAIRQDPAPMQEAFKASHAETIKSILIPAIESITSQTLEKVSQHMETKYESKLEAISKQLSTMTALVTELTKEVQALRINGSIKKEDKETPEVDTTEEEKLAIVALINEGDYEGAFTKAVSHPTVEMTQFCCANASLQQVLGGPQPALSQPILLCLMQQLGTTLVSALDPQMELDWLQEIALSLDPSYRDIARLVQPVLQQVVASVQKRMKNDNSASLRRPLQRMLQVLRGMQMG